MKKLFLITAALLYTVPGIAILLSGIGTPPGYKLLFGGVVESFGALALTLTAINKKKLKSFTPSKITKLSIILSIFFISVLSIYIMLFNLCVIEHERGTAYYPLWISGHISDMVQRAGSRSAAIERYGIDGVIGAINEMPDYVRIITTIILLLIYQAIFTSLAVVFSLLGIYRTNFLLQEFEDKNSDEATLKKSDSALSRQVTSNQIIKDNVSAAINRNNSPYNDFQREKSTLSIPDSQTKTVSSTTKLNRNQLFISYSHKDARWLERLKTHLKPYERQGIILYWDDTKIQPGQKWRDEVNKAIDSAKIVLLLVSADFLASDFIMTNELPPLLAAAENEGAVIFSLIIKPCLYNETKSISQFQAINSPAKTLAEISSPERDRVFVRLVNLIEESLKANP